jgi:hypothetical protein
MTRQLAIAKKVSLDGIGPGWGDECYAMMLPATYQDMLDIDALDDKKRDAYVEFQLEFLKRHFVEGKIRVVGEEQPVDMEPDDVGASIALTDRLFLACLGNDIDPKEASPEAGTTDEPKSDEKPTETPSSTASNTSPTSTPEK